MNDSAPPGLNCRPSEGREMDIQASPTADPNDSAREAPSARAAHHFNNENDAGPQNTPAYTSIITAASIIRNINVNSTNWDREADNDYSGDESDVSLDRRVSFDRLLRRERQFQAAVRRFHRVMQSPLLQRPPLPSIDRFLPILRGNGPLSLHAHNRLEPRLEPRVEPVGSDTVDDAGATTMTFSSNSDDDDWDDTYAESE